MALKVTVTFLTPSLTADDHFLAATVDSDGRLALS
jgi:hypothetical protein